MSFRQLPAIIVSIFLGLGLAQVNDAPRGPDRTRPAAQDGQHNTVAPAPRQTSGGQASSAQSVEGGRPYHDLHGTPRRAAGGRQWSRRWVMYGDDGGLYRGDGLVVYWAPGRWYPYPGFGDNRHFMPQLQGVWGR